MLLNFKIFTTSLKYIDLKSVRVINTINPHSYCVSKEDKEFEDALNASDILLPDGVGFVLAAKILNNQTIKRITGADIHQYLLQQANFKSQKVFYLGAAQSTLRLIETKVKNNYPNITVSSLSPPYKSQFSDKETTQMLEKINEFRPDILFVGMTAPKQEKWVFNNKENINANIIVSVGAVFDFYAGNVKRSSTFWINLGLEWLPRLVREPRRLFYRNFVSTPKFILEILSFKIFGKGIL